MKIGLQVPNGRQRWRQTGRDSAVITRMKSWRVQDTRVRSAVPISKGHWDGDTLAVETEAFRDNTLIDNLAPHGYDLKTTERIRLKRADTLKDHITIEDPQYFTRPWQTIVSGA